MLNTAEAARFLRVSQASIRRWSDSGRLPASRVGGRRERRFKASDLEAFLAGASAKTNDGGITVGGVTVPVPSHLAPFYTTDAGRFRLSIPFLAEGLRLGQPGLLVATASMVSRYEAALGDQRNETFHPIPDLGRTVAEAISGWEHRLGSMVARGATPIRIVGEMADERRMFESDEEMLRYEEAFELMSKRFPIVVLCQYDAREFDGLALVRAMKAHPDSFQLRLGTFLN